MDASRCFGLIGTLFAAALAHALPADIDPGFGPAGGIAIADVTSPFARWSPHPAVLQPDGKLVVLAGIRQPTVGVTNPSKVSWQIRRYTAGGLPDASFGAGGSAMISFDLNFGGFLGDDYPNGVALFPDGRILVAGHSLGSSSQCSFGCESQAIMARFNVDGSLDSSFGNNGTLLGGNSLGNDAVAIQSDGKILTSGNQSIPRTRIAFMRLGRVNADGTGDSSFAPSYACDGNGAFRVAPDGKIVIGTTDPSGNFCISRLSADGALDTSFGTQGRTVVTSNDNSSILGDFFVDAAGAITGFATTGMWFHLTANGSPDATFGVARVVGYDTSRTASTGIGDCSTRAIVATQAAINSGFSFSTARFAPGAAPSIVAFAGTASRLATTNAGGRTMVPLQLLLRPNERIVALAASYSCRNIDGGKGWTTWQLRRDDSHVRHRRITRPKNSARRTRRPRTPSRAPAMAPRWRS